MRVAVALSGGVDSAVAALLLKRAGHQVHGVFMQNWDARIEDRDDGRPVCTAESDYHDARRVADCLRIELTRVNFVRAYWNDVFARTLEAYRAGRTPNPDLLCNREIKMGRLWEWARAREYDCLATGHYARISEWQGRQWIAQAACREKDQSYFLAGVERAVLPHLLFPIGGMRSKEAVRSLAREAQMGFLLHRAESMGLCFVGKRRRFQEFLTTFAQPISVPVIEEETGRVLCQEHGEFVTVGQTVRIGGLSSKLFCVGRKGNTILASFNPRHSRLYPKQICIRLKMDETEHCNTNNDLACSLRSCDKEGVPLKDITRLGTDVYRLDAEAPFYAPAPGQYGVVYKRLLDAGGDETKIVAGYGEIVDLVCK